MALKATLYKAELQIADMDRRVYRDHALTLALHPSETVERMMGRVLAYALYACEGIAFTGGLSEVDQPDIWGRNLAGETTLWIELGQPDEAHIRRACRVSLYPEQVVFSLLPARGSAVRVLRG